MPKEKIFYRKLIRDKIPKIIENDGGEYETRILDEEERKSELIKKLAEETKELANAPQDRTLNELADIMEVTESIGESQGFTFKKIRQTQLERRKKRGGFKKGIFLIWSIWGNKK